MNFRLCARLDSRTSIKTAGAVAAVSGVSNGTGDAPLALIRLGPRLDRHRRRVPPPSTRTPFVRTSREERGWFAAARVDHGHHRLRPTRGYTADGHTTAHRPDGPRGVITRSSAVADPALVVAIRFNELIILF